MFVKTIRKTVREDGGEGVAGMVSLYECEWVHFKHNNNRSSTITLEPSDIEIIVKYDKDGESDVDVYYMNNEGRTIDKVT